MEDRTRHVRGVPDALDLEERLASLASDRISPRLVPEIEIHEVATGELWLLVRSRPFPEQLRSAIEQSGAVLVTERRRPGIVAVRYRLPPRATP